MLQAEKKAYIPWNRSLWHLLHLVESEIHMKNEGKSAANANGKERVLLTILAVSCRTRRLCDSSQASSTAFMASKNEQHGNCNDRRKKCSVINSTK